MLTIKSFSSWNSVEDTKDSLRKWTLNLTQPHKIRLCGDICNNLYAIIWPYL